MEVKGMTGPNAHRETFDDLCGKITAEMIASLEGGTVPWRKPWICGIPRNFVSKKEYCGINIFMLPLRPFPSPWWATEKQIRKLGGSIRPGETGTPIICWFRSSNPDVRKNQDPAKRSGGMSHRVYIVFNTSQCDGLRVPDFRVGGSPVEAAEAIIAGYRECPVCKTYDSAAYSPSDDLIFMPDKGLFRSIEEYYATYFHEIAHSTGHPSRLDRQRFSEPIVSRDLYSKEELVAEMANCFLCGESGIRNSDVIENQAAYLASWIGALRASPRLLIAAAADAQKAFNYILHRAPARSRKKKPTSNG